MVAIHGCVWTCDSDGGRIEIVVVMVAEVVVMVWWCCCLWCWCSSGKFKFFLADLVGLFGNKPAKLL